MTYFDGSSIAGDLAYVDGAETVTYLAISPGGNISVTVANAVGDVLTRAEAIALGGLFDGSQRAWILPAGPLSAMSITPKEADSLTQGTGTAWYVISSEADPLTLAYRLVCSKGR